MNLRFPQKVGIYSLAERLLASRGLRFMELANLLCTMNLLEASVRRQMFTILHPAGRCTGQAVDCIRDEAGSNLGSANGYSD